MTFPQAIEKLSRHAPVTIFALGILFLLPTIWSETSVTGQDEYWLSFRTPMETTAHSDWVTTWVNGEPRLKKPPLLYWAIALSYKMFGINLFAARIWGVLSGAGLALCSCLLARELFAKSCFLAGLITLGTVGVAIQGRTALLDLPLAFFTSLAVYLALRWWKSGCWRHILSCAVSLGAAFMLKGPVGPYFFVTAVLTGLSVFGKWRSIFSRFTQIVAATGLLLAICLPWPIAMVYLWPGFSHTVGAEMGKRHYGDLSYILSALGGALGLIFPWTLVLIAAVVYSLYRAWHTPDRRSMWLIVWYVSSAVPFFFMQSFERYMLPLMPAMCVLCALWLEESTWIWKSLLLRTSVYLTALAALLVSIFLLWFGIGILPAILCLCLVLMSIWSAHSIDSNHVCVMFVAVLLAFVVGGLYPSIGINAMPSDLETIVGGHPVAVFRSPQPSMLSIRLQRSVIPIDTSRPTGINSLDHFDGFVFMEEAHAPGFEAAAEKYSIKVEKMGQFKTFFSRKTWLRFARKDATSKDWKNALKARSLENLKSGICFYRVLPR